jgi:hypothetical protein
MRFARLAVIASLFAFGGCQGEGPAQPQATTRDAAADIAEIRARLKGLGQFDHEGYSGPASKNGWTVTLDGVVGPFMLMNGSRVEWRDDVDSVIALMTDQSPEPTSPFVPRRFDPVGNGVIRPGCICGSCSANGGVCVMPSCSCSGRPR